MFLPIHRFIRGIVLGLMFFLAGTAYCSCDSYDPNPYDDIPPVVTVEFNYIVPAQVSIRLPNVQARNRTGIPFCAHVGNTHAWRGSLESPALVDILSKPASLQNPSHMVIPLRC
jgi:hypothetical protein